MFWAPSSHCSPCRHWQTNSTTCTKSNSKPNRLKQPLRPNASAKRQPNGHATKRVALLIVGNLVAYLLGAFAQSAFLSGCLDLADGRPVTIGSFFKPRNFGMAYLAALLVGLVTWIGFSLCFVPGLVVSLFVQFTILFVVDRSQSAIKGFTSSFSLVGSNFANALLVWLSVLALTVLGLLACGVGLVVAAPLGALVLTYAYRKLSGGHVVPLGQAGYQAGPPPA